MNAMWAVFLGAGGAAGLFSFIYTVYKDFRDRRRTARKQEGEIQIDSVTEKRIAAEAAQINSDVAIAQQNWWKSQFEYLREELTVEQKSNRELRAWAREHQTWDQRAWHLAVQSDPNYPPPPKLEDI